MKRMTPEQVETAKFRAAVAAASLQGDPDRAEDFEDMTVEEYAELRGIEIVNGNPAPAVLALVNPNYSRKGANKKMATQKDRIARLESELEEANARIEELEDERADALNAFSSAFGVEIIDDGDDFEDEESDGGNGEED